MNLPRKHLGVYHVIKSLQSIDSKVRDLADNIKIAEVRAVLDDLHIVLMSSVIQLNDLTTTKGNK